MYANEIVRHLHVVPMRVASRRLHTRPFHSVPAGTIGIAEPALDLP